MHIFKPGRGNKTKALEDIKRLAIQLKDLNISTGKELLMDSYVYEKEYKLVNKEDSIIPKIYQKKYIMIPVYDDGEIKEVSLLQEHIIGSKYYVISYGEPTKQKVLDKYEEVKNFEVEDAFLTEASGYSFYNTSKYDFEKLLSDPDNIESNFNNYINMYTQIL